MTEEQIMLPSISGTLNESGGSGGHLDNNSYHRENLINVQTESSN